MAKVGIDVDGVLACFDPAFVKVMIEVTGEDRFGKDVEDLDHFPPIWDFPQLYGYTDEQCKAVWKEIHARRGFWQNLNPQPDAADAIRDLSRFRDAGHEVYFVTDRGGVQAKRQTEDWLRDHGMEVPTVIISGQKGLALGLLNLDCYIDDKLTHANSCAMVVRQQQRLTRVYLLDRPWNQEGVEGNDQQMLDPLVRRIFYLQAMFRAEEL